jgi:hypothetical protein
VPYIITHFEHGAAGPLGLKVGEPCYPFALPRQTISWEVETPQLLLELFEQRYQALQQDRASERVKGSA